MGTDLVFESRGFAPDANWGVVARYRGVCRCAGVGVYLAAMDGWPILAFALLGGVAAIFYVAPPIRWAYRAWVRRSSPLLWPWLVLGSLYLQTGGVSWMRLRLARYQCL